MGWDSKFVDDLRNHLFETSPGEFYGFKQTSVTPGVWPTAASVSHSRIAQWNSGCHLSKITIMGGKTFSPSVFNQIE